jgi:hypothetical protein
MLRKTMVALCAIASIGMLAPDMALARGGHGGGGGGGMGGGGGRGMGGGSFGGHANFSGGNFAGRGMNTGNFNSFARATPNVAVQGNRFAGQSNFAGNRFAHANWNRPGFNHGFRHRHVFFAGGFIGPGYDYWDYPDYAYNDYYDDGGCYIVQRRIHTSYGWRVRPVQVCG